MLDANQLQSIVAGWGHAVCIREISSVLSNMVGLIRTCAPIESVVLHWLHPPTKSIKRVGSFGLSDFLESQSGPIVCSEAKWTSIDLWCRTGGLLQQQAPKRTGKLSLLTSPDITNEVVAIPLRPHANEKCDDLVPVGAALFLIETNRSLREEQFQYLSEWSAPMWLAMEQAVRPEWLEMVGMEGNPESPSGLTRPVDDARESIVGSDSGLRAVMERVQIVAPSDMPVLILGETGTGKEVVARAIHSRSPRHAKPFIRVNCGAIPTELVDSHLFGHERGSFTGASDQRKGWFERADGGTLFLDEIGELPLAAQVRLLRVLQEHQIERVGGQESIHVDVRIVAATHRDLSTMVHQRSFREDLWYRINMFPILLPGLRERIEDIPSLTRHFARRAANRFGLPYVEPTHADMKQLMDYRWPGNIRELQAVIDRAVILGRGATLDVSKSLGNSMVPPVAQPVPTDEPTFYEVIPESASIPMVTKVAEAPMEDGPVDSLDSAIVRHIERALATTGGQIEGHRGAAKLLNINPHTLRAKMRKLKVDWDRFRRY